MRRFVVGWERKQAVLREKGLQDVGSDSEDEEIVFVGRGGAMLDARGKSTREEEEEEVRRERLVFDSLADDRSASFGYEIPLPHLPFPHPHSPALHPLFCPIATSPSCVQ